jgi:anti-sigma regulatory factor (Ser/Thr protein kinase)
VLLALTAGGGVEELEPVRFPAQPVRASDAIQATTRPRVVVDQAVMGLDCSSVTYGHREAGHTCRVTTEPDSSEVQVDLPGDLTAAREARAATRQVLPRWRLTGLLDPVLLVVSELVGNAVRHGRPPVDLRLRKSGGGVRVDVHDEATLAPRPGELGHEAESGRGMLLVDAVSAETGVEQIDGDGKVVWARIDPEPDSR